MIRKEEETHQTMDEAAILARTRAYVHDTFLYMRPGFSLGDQDRLLQRGVIDSMGVMELIAFLRSEFGVVVADDDITESNLGTLADIARYVRAHSNGNGRKAAENGAAGAAA
ncbi:MAG TPA: acyl carrier protein [Gemmatimonadales bacterium]|nr:acyl carrier protein [Gemmatimonadales bacterium]